MCGTAITVRVRPGDNLMILKALQMVRPGNVLVIDGGGDTSRAVVGGIMRAIALKAGLAGIVINGAMRDLEDWIVGSLPIYALECTHRGPSTEGSGEINVSVSCSGLVVNPGDLVVGDGDGVVAVDCKLLDEVLAQSNRLLEREKKMLADIENDALDKGRFDEPLRARGCPI